MKSKTSTTYSYVASIKMGLILNTSRDDAYLNPGDLSISDKKAIVGGYLFFDEEYYGPIRAAEYVLYEMYIVTDYRLPKKMESQHVSIYKKESVTTTTYPPFYHKAKKGQSLYVKKNGVIGNEPDVYVKTGGTIKKLY